MTVNNILPTQCLEDGLNNKSSGYSRLSDALINKNNSFSLSDAFSKTDQELVLCGTRQTILNQKRWLLEFGRTGKVIKSCEITGFAHSTIYNEWLKDPDFQQYFKLAELQHLHRMEEEADRRAIAGIDKGVYWQGEKVAVEKQYSDVLLMFRMKKLDPSYRENQQINIDNRTDVRKIEYHFDQPVPIDQVDSPKISQDSPLTLTPDRDYAISSSQQPSFESDNEPTIVCDALAGARDGSPCLTTPASEQGLTPTPKGKGNKRIKNNPGG